MTAYIYHLIADRILYLKIYFFKKEFTNLSFQTTTFLVGAPRFGVPFPKLQIFLETFWALHIHYSQYEKMILGIFVHLLIYEVTMTKVNFRF